MTDPRTILEAYGGETAMKVGAIPVFRGEQAPKTFTALRAVLDLADHYDDLADRMWTSSAADDIRRAITTALEAS